MHQVKPGEDVMKAANSGDCTIIGDADFDLAYYANHPHIKEDRLPLKNCQIDSNAYILIYIKTNSEEILKQSSRPAAITQEIDETGMTQ